MLFEDEFVCPKCEKDNVDTVSFAYRALKSRGAGRQLFSDSPVRRQAAKISPHEREKLIEKLAPPKEPRISLPAGTIAVMAFTVSWLATSSAIISLVGPKIYIIASLIISIVIVIFFYMTLKTVMKAYRKRLLKYRKAKTLYNKKCFCNDCHYIFDADEIRQE